MRLFPALFPSASALAALVLIVGGCQPAAEGGDPDALLDGFEAAMEALTDAATTHAEVIAAAADEAAVLAEEAAFAESGHDLFEEAVHTSEELVGCAGMDMEEAEFMPQDVHDMMVELDETFEAHEGAMTDAAEADRPGVEQAFQDEITLHAEHGVVLHDDMHSHAEAGELECANHEDEE